MGLRGAALSSLKQSSSGAHFDLLEFQSEEDPLGSFFTGPGTLKSVFICLGTVFFFFFGRGGPPIFFSFSFLYTEASKNNGIIIALTTRGVERERRGETSEDRRPSGGSGGRGVRKVERGKGSNECSK